MMENTSVEQLNNWMGSPTENQHLEFKEAKNQMPDEDICKYCVAIANEHGGQLILGVTDKLPRQIVGTSAVANPTKMIERLQSLLHFRVDVEEMHHPDGRVVIFHIPSRLSGSAYNYKGQYLMRCGAQLLPMGEDQLRKIFAETRADWLEENSRVELSAQEVIELLDTQTFFELFKQAYPTNRQGVLDRLKQERLISQDGEFYSIKRICALLYAKRLQDFPELERKAARVIVYRGGNKLETTIDKPGGKGYAVGFQGLIAYIMSQLPQNEVIKDSLREEVKFVPEIVIRELVANALIHQDFAIGGTSAMIEVYADRVEISSPGLPVVPTERFIDGYQSRNERLAELMRRIGICEEKGSGIDKVVNSVEAYQLPAPYFGSIHERTMVKLFRYHPFDEMAREDRIRACYQHACLKWVMNEQMTNQSLRERFKLPENKSAIVSQVIAFALDAGSIKADEAMGGSRKFARYLPFWA